MQPSDTFLGLGYIKSTFAARARQHRHFYVFRAQQTCLMATKCSLSLRVLLQISAGFEGSL